MDGFYDDDTPDRRYERPTRTQERSQRAATAPTTAPTTARPAYPDGPGGYSTAA